jgi:hypothetical protein
MTYTTTHFYFFSKEYLGKFHHKTHSFDGIHIWDEMRLVARFLEYTGLLDESWCIIVKGFLRSSMGYVLRLGVVLTRRINTGVRGLLCILHAYRWYYRTVNGDNGNTIQFIAIVSSRDFRLNFVSLPFCHGTWKEVKVSWRKLNVFLQPEGRDRQTTGRGCQK